MSDLTTKKNLSFCIDPFIHLATRPLGIVKTCCNTDMHIGNLNEDNLETLWNSDTMKNIRLKMLKGEKVENCKRCYIEEAVGFESKRIKQNRKWSHVINEAVLDVKPDGSLPNKIKFLDLRYGIKCNLKCVICDNTNSSQWIPEQKNIYPKMKNPLMKDYYKQFNIDVKTPSYWYKNPVIQKQISDQLKHIEHLYFAGGEPLIIDEHYKVLEECIVEGYAGDIELRYNSNATKWKDNLFDLWKNFKSVSFCYSIDDIGKRNDYIRYPSQWEKTKESLKFFDEKAPENVNITITCSVQILNVYYIPDFIMWIFHQFFKRIKDIQFHLVYYPPQLSPKVMPVFYKKKLSQKYNQFLSELCQKRQKIDHFKDERRNDCFQKYFQTLDSHKEKAFQEVFNNRLIERLKSIMRFIESEDYSYRLPALKEYLQLLDSRRGTSFQKVFPELNEMFKVEGEK
ncbi:MAG: twitch domain-containing radical SAM protein [Oligoflexia bacterium]|nr:twitch domain-containing radical SAM protein [Oligoflexia bacterium]